MLYCPGISSVIVLMCSRRLTSFSHFESDPVPQGEQVVITIP